MSHTRPPEPTRCYPSSPNVVVNNLPGNIRTDWPESSHSASPVDNSYWGVENEIPMQGVRNTSVRKRTRNEDISRSNDENEEEKNSKQVKVTSIQGEGINAASLYESLQSDSEHLDRIDCGGKVFKSVIVASATSRNIFTNPSLTRDLLKSAGFGDCLENGIEVKGRGRSVRLQVDVSKGIDVSKIKKIGEYDVHCWCPLSVNCKIGVISPIDTNMNLETEVIPKLNILGNHNMQCRIVDAKRLKRGGNDLELVKVIFDGYLPDRVEWEHQVFRVRPFIHDPIRCFKCQMYGHGSNSCNGKLVCPFCNNNHSLRECERRENNYPCCLHCKMNHITGSRDCEFFKQAAVIEKKKQDGAISYEESKKQYAVLNNKKIGDFSPKPVNDSTRNRIREDNIKVNAGTTVIHNLFDLDNVHGANLQRGSITTCYNKYQTLSDLDEQELEYDDFFESPPGAHLNNSTPKRKKKKVLKYENKKYSEVAKTGIHDNLNNKTTLLRSPKVSQEFQENLQVLRNVRRPKQVNDRREEQECQDSLRHTIKNFRESLILKLFTKIKTFLREMEKSVESWLKILVEICEDVVQCFDGEF